MKANLHIDAAFHAASVRQSYGFNFTLSSIKCQTFNYLILVYDSAFSSADGFPVFTDIVVETAPRQIAAKIKEAIVEGRLEIDTRLPTEDDLAAQFGVSRATIREALKRLASENLVEARRGASGGNFVKMPSHDDIRNGIATSIQVAAALGRFTFEDVLESRQEFESLCCRLAAKNRTQGDLDALRAELVVQRSVLGDDVAFCASDVRFHCLLAEASHNQLIKAALSGMAQGLQPATNLMLFRYRDGAVIVEQHEKIVDCLEARDGERAVAVVGAQIEYLLSKRDVALKQTKMRRNAARRTS